MKACKKADGKRGAEGAIGPYQDFGRNRSKTFFFKKPFDSYLPLQFSDLPMALQQDRSRGGGRPCKMKMKNAGHSLVMAHPEFAEVQIDNLSKGVPPDVISFLPHSARKHAEIFSCQTFTF